MIEHLLTKYEDHYNYTYLAAFSALITLLLGLFSALSFNHPYILTGLIALSLAYPSSKHLLKQEKKITSLRKLYQSSFYIQRELLIYGSIFMGVTISLYLLNSFNLIANVHVYEEVINTSITGQFSNPNAFINLFQHNAIVFFLTFILTLITFNGFLFILTWNSGVLAYYLSELGSQGLTFAIAILPHLILEISGFILAGLAGNILTYYRKPHPTKKRLILLAFLFLGIGMLLITIGAGIESIGA